MERIVSQERELFDVMGSPPRWNDFQSNQHSGRFRHNEGLGLHTVTMRLPKMAIEKFKHLAQEQGLGYQPFVRQILMNYLRDHS